MPHARQLTLAPPECPPAVSSTGASMAATQTRYMSAEEKRLAWMWHEEDGEDALPT